MPKFRAAGSRLAFAVALATTAAVGLTATATPALAQKKGKDKEQAVAPKADYSKAFIAAYQPVSKALSEGPDPAAVKAQLPAVIAAAETPDDRFAAGQLVFSAGSKTSDTALQRQGLGMMLDSGKTPAADLARNSFAAAQLAYNAKEWAEVRRRAEQAMAAGYDGDAELLIAETYFAENQVPTGLDALDKAIARKVAAGQKAPEAWLKRAVAQAYQAKLEAQSMKYAGMYAQYYPSKSSWGDAIAIQRNFRDYDGQELLDLLRLAARADALRYERDYVDYITAADARRLPGETQRVIDAGIAAGLLKSGDVFVTEARNIASGRVKADLADLPGLERDAKASGSTAATAMAAGDAFLSYNQPAKAEEFYNLALGRPGVDTARVLTRLGIAQLDQGKIGEAQANFAKVDGARQAIARLWGVYAAQRAGAAASTAP
ncbi:hypothetical protein A6F68_02176 [Tsuneonella dongtanensis]|uniref:Tetratricopeptide repeat protein n=1 Tax=Tsuneonella dongtanensis TaxID=692370 RepID=A0A1B2AEU4_9SPHN|nr:hypothetical protein [Tsuneonella dongtanensis]ANY20677.1 hypothetical protein A6F68_02176 [Tsuneonella dongtanensis]